MCALVPAGDRPGTSDRPGLVPGREGWARARMAGRGVAVLLLVSGILGAEDRGKYSQAANQQIYPDEKSPILNFGAVKEPFRMSKVNLLWEKAKSKGLVEGKLEQLYSQLKVQDKDELTLKKLRTEGSDKDGVKEAEVRKRFAGIMESFGLAGGQVEAREAGEDTPKALFRDKKLARLWEKVGGSVGGFDSRNRPRRAAWNTRSWWPCRRSSGTTRGRSTSTTPSSRSPARTTTGGSTTSRGSWIRRCSTSGTPTSTTGGSPGFTPRLLQEGQGDQEGLRPAAPAGHQPAHRGGQPLHRAQGVPRNFDTYPRK